MSRTVRVPDPVYKAIRREADARDVHAGVVVEGWMQAARNEGRLAGAIPRGVPEGAPRNSDDDPVLNDGGGSDE